MQTLKKVLALSLVFAFAFTMMAGATTVFTDDSSIDAQKQVNLVYALGIMKGYPDGSFGAAKTITRAEAAKMIYVMKTGADVGSDNYKTAANPFTDVASTHWAKGYINYCYLNGIIAGVGGGKFNPEGQVTGAQLAKMLLTIIGYDATKAKLTGDQWLISTMSLAFENNLFDDYTADVAAPAPREDAAVIFYNTVFTETVVLRDGEYVNYDLLGNSNPTVGKKNFALEEYEGVVIGAEGLDLTSDASAGADDTLYLNVTDAVAGTIKFDSTAAGDADISVDYEGGKEFLGQKVKVVYDSKKDVVYNIVSTGKNKVYEMTVGDIDASGANIKFGGKTYTYPSATAAATVQFVNYAGVGGATYDIAARTNADPVRLVDNDGNGAIDFVFITGRVADYVDSLDSDKVSFLVSGLLDIENDDGDVMVEMNDAEEGDYVYIYPEIETTVPADNTYIVEKMSSVTASVEGISGTTKAKINGAFVSMSDIGGGAGTLNDIDLTEDASDLDISSEYTFYMDGKYFMGFVAGEDAVATSGDYCLVVDVQNKSGSGITAKDPKVQVIIPGEDDPVTYVLDSGKVYTGAGTLSDITKTNMENTDSTVGTQTNIMSKVFAYSITSAGKIKLTQNFANYTGQTIPVVAYTAVTTGAKSVLYNNDNGVFTDGTNSYLLADDAVIFYRTGGAWEVYDKGDFNTSIAATNADLCSIVYKSSGGFKYIQTAVFADGVWNGIANVGVTQTGTASDIIYGYVTADVEISKDGDDDVVKYTIFDGTTTKTYVEKETATPVAAKGDFVSFKLNASGDIKSGEITDLTTVGGVVTALNTPTPATDTPYKAAITAYNSTTKYVTLVDDYTGGAFSGIFKVASDVQTVVVDTGDTKGIVVTGASVFRKAALGSDNNCIVVFNSDDEVCAIIVDVDSDLAAF